MLIAHLTISIFIISLYLKKHRGFFFVCQRKQRFTALRLISVPVQLYTASSAFSHNNISMNAIAKNIYAKYVHLWPMTGFSCGAYWLKPDIYSNVWYFRVMLWLRNFVQKRTLSIYKLHPIYHKKSALLYPSLLRIIYQKAHICNLYINLSCALCIKYG